MPKAAQHHALARQWQILRLLPTKPPGMTSRELVDRLEREGFSVTKRTVERDLAELSTIFGIACNDKGMPYGWHWMKGEYADLPGLSVSDALSLRLVEDLLRPLLPSAILESLEARFGQAKAKLAELSADNPNARWADKVRYVSPTLPFVPPKIDPAVLDAVHEALLTEHQIAVEYQKASGEQQTYRLHPLGLVQRGQITYLVATAYEYTDVRLYAVHRIKAVACLADGAIRPKHFSLEEYASSGAMEFGSPGLVELEAWVSEDLAAVLQETPISAQQELIPVKGGCLLSAKVQNSWQLTWWVLSQAENICVMQPVILKTAISEHLRKTIELYQ